MKSVLAPLVLVASLAVPATAQTLLTTGGTFVNEQIGGSNACAYPNGPYYGSFGTQATFPCGVVLGAFPGTGGAQLGDVAIDRVNDLVYATDGTTIAVFTAAGAPVRSFQLASILPTYHGSVTGLGFDGAAGLLWVTNGSRAAAILPATTPCFGTSVLVHEFELPSAFAPYLDLDWHPGTNTLFLAGAAGNVVNLNTNGTYAANGFDATTLVPSLVEPFTGLAVDTSTGGSDWALYLTDGATIERVEQGFGFTPTFHWPVKSAPVLFPGTAGLAWTAHDLDLGSTSTLLPPTLRARGNAVSPNPNFEIVLPGGTPGTVALVFYSLGTFCPAPPFLGGKLFVNAANQVGVGTFPASGDLVIPAPLPANMSRPTTVYSQAFVWSGSSFSSTNGMSFAIAQP